VAIHIVDRRLNPGSKSLENRQRFLRRAKARVQGAVKKSSQDREIRDVLEGGEVSIPLDGMNEPRFLREGGTRNMVLPGNKKFIEGDMLPRSGEGRGPAGCDYATVYIAFELSKSKWQLGVMTPGAEKMSRYRIDGGNLAELSGVLARARAKAELASAVPADSTHRDQLFSRAHS
jgi:hypothetical protein